jgi:hypothetical protein
MTNLAETFGKLTAGVLMWAIIFAAGMATAYYGAYVLGYHWQWFLVPEGFDLPSMRARIGMLLIVGLFIMGPISVISWQIAAQGTENKEIGEKTKAVVRMVMLVIGITLSWASGYIWNWILG